MATKRKGNVTQKEAEEFVHLYAEFGTYAEVARQTGRSPSTVKRHIEHHYLIVGDEIRTQLEKVISKFGNNIIIIAVSALKEIVAGKNLAEWIEMTQEEKDEIEAFRKEFENV